MKGMNGGFFLTLLIPVLVILGFAGCQRNPGLNKKMNLAEDIMEADPDSAWKILSSIDSREISSDSEKARYNLNDAYCRYKTWQNLPSDSILASCAEYYSRSNGKEYMKILFLRAFIAREEERFGESVAYLVEASDIAEKLHDLSWQANIAASLSDNFRDARNIEKYYEYSNRAANLYRAAGKERHALFMRVYHADAISDTGDKKRSLQLLDSVTEIALKDPVDMDLLETSLTYKYQIEFFDGKPEESLKTYRLLTHYVGEGGESAIKEAQLARMFLMAGDEKSALSHLEKGDSLSKSLTDSSAMSQAWSNYYSYKGNYKKSQKFADALIDKMNGRFKELLSESAMSGVGSYYNKKADLQTKKSEQRKLLLIILSSVAVLIIAAGLLLYRYRIKAKNAEIESKIMNIMHVTELLESKSREADALAATVERQRNDMKTLEDRLDNAGSTEINREIENLFREKWTLLNMLCKRFYNMDGSRLSKDLLLKDIEGEVAKLTSGTNLKTIEDCVNRYMNGIVDSLREDCGFLSPADLKFLTLLFAGFNIDAISMFLRINKSTAYMRKSRLRTKIAESDYARKHTILDRL